MVYNLVSFLWEDFLSVLYFFKNHERLRAFFIFWNSLHLDSLPSTIVFSRVRKRPNRSRIELGRIDKMRETELGRIEQIRETELGRIEKIRETERGLN